MTAEQQLDRDVANAARDLLRESTELLRRTGKTEITVTTELLLELKILVRAQDALRRAASAGDV